MVRQYYVNEITDISQGELDTICRTVEPPVCLLGGWAVHLHANEKFHDEYGREYIGSRDVDLGFHVDPEWTEDELLNASVGKSVKQLEDHGFIPFSFRFVRYYHRETGEVLKEDEAKRLASHQLFEMYLDVIPDTDELDTFQEVFGFRPPAEPLLTHVFEDNAGSPLADFVHWDVPEQVLISDPDLLAAMKMRSIPDRNKYQKRVKDVADLHALLWYVMDYQEIQSRILEWVSDADIQQMRNIIDDQVYKEAADLLQIDKQLVQNSIGQFIQ